MKRLVLAGALLLALPATASASTVSVVLADGCAGDVACSKYGGAGPVPVTTVQGAPGEANRIAIARSGGDFVIRDDGATLIAAAPCVSQDAHSARCPVTEGSQGVRGLGAGLGDGDDALVVEGDLRVETSIAGGDGKDVVEGGAEPDAVDGGPGGDRLLGDGGIDELSYTTRTAPVVVDLAAEAGGEAGEGDGVAGFEVLLGGSGDDVLRGAAGPETIDGGGGDDALYDTGGRNSYRGGPGADILEGGAGSDLMDAGSGPDLVLARGGGRDRVRCGAGRDRARTDRRDARRSCERR